MGDDLILTKAVSGYGDILSDEKKILKTFCHRIEPFIGKYTWLRKQKTLRYS